MIRRWGWLLLLLTGCKTSLSTRPFEESELYQLPSTTGNTTVCVCTQHSDQQSWELLRQDQITNARENLGTFASIDACVQAKTESDACPLHF